MIVVEHWEIIKCTRRGKPRPHRIACLFDRGRGRGVEIWIVRNTSRRRRQRRAILDLAGSTEGGRARDVGLLKVGQEQM